MDPLRVLVETAGFFTRAQARDLGWKDRDVSAAMCVKLWHRIRRGYYTFTDTWAGLDAVQRHLVLCRAVMHSLGDDHVALSHQSGCVAHGIDTWAIDLSRVHVTRLDGAAGRVEGDVVHHEGFAVDTDLCEANGLRVLTPARCALEAGSRANNEAALVVLDGLLRRELVDHEELMKQFALMQRWPFLQHLHVVVRMADGGSQSVGESRGRYLFWCFGIPCPTLQFEITDAQGNLLGITDWAWPEHGVLGEFDGRVKYGRLLRPDQNAGDVVFAEKQREELLCRTTGMSMVRVIWSDLDRPRLTASRFQRALNRTG